MTIIRKYSEKETKEEIDINIEINTFYLKYTLKNGEVIEIKNKDLSKFYSIQLFGINERRRTK